MSKFKRGDIVEVLGGCHDTPQGAIGTVKRQSRLGIDESYVIDFPNGPAWMWCDEIEGGNGWHVRTQYLRLVDDTWPGYDADE